jgi:lipoprotein-anchoring transpeptidase ErfK/SrfK
LLKQAEEEQMKIRITAGPIMTLMLIGLMTAACGRTERTTIETGGDGVVATETGQQPSATGMELPPQQPRHDMRLEVDLAARELHVYRGNERVETHPVAVGSEEWPTPTGEWSIGQVVWNPRWVPPPDESWAEDEETKEPGDPENPLGRAQLVYSPPNSIHGTIDPDSLGKAVSHGSIRVSNEVAMELARQVMEAGGAGQDESWYRQARENRTERRSVTIPDPVPIRVVAGNR